MSSRRFIAVEMLPSTESRSSDSSRPRVMQLRKVISIPERPESLSVLVFPNQPACDVGNRPCEGAEEARPASCMQLILFQHLVLIHIIVKINISVFSCYGANACNWAANLGRVRNRPGCPVAPGDQEQIFVDSYRLHSTSLRALRCMLLMRLLGQQRCMWHGHSTDE